MYTAVKAAAISIKPRKWDKDYDADKIEAFFVEAAAERPDLILTTEGVLEGYVANEVLERPDLEERMIEIAEPIDGPYIRRFRNLARHLGTCLAFGFAERIGRDVYNTALFIDHEGEIRGKYHNNLRRLRHGRRRRRHRRNGGELHYQRGITPRHARRGGLLGNDRLALNHLRVHRESLSEDGRSDILGAHWSA